MSVEMQVSATSTLAYLVVLPISFMTMG